MVVERLTTQYVCKFCQKAYSTREEAGKCENKCRRLADSPGLEKLNLSPRAFNALYYVGIYTISDLVKLTDQELLEIKGFGRRSLLEVKDKLKQYGV